MTNSISPARAVPRLVNSSAILAECLRNIDTGKSIAVDCEGENLSRTGRLCLLQLFVEGSDTIWIVDIVELGDQAFSDVPEGSSRSLQVILRDPRVEKLFWDVRCDANALFFQYKVTLRGVYDIQLQRLGHEQRDFCGWRRLSSLAFCISEFTHPDHRVANSGDIKAAGKKLFREERFAVLSIRPLRREILDYAALDVRHLFELQRKVGSYRRRSIRERVKIESERRVRLAETDAFDAEAGKEKLGRVVSDEDWSSPL
ncbi:exonuclease 3'-5' domain-containing protein 1, partial [Phenoliferia sp. Uapishka_3]